MYHSQIDLFNRWKHAYPIPAIAIALWHELAIIWRDTGYQSSFSYPNQNLQTLCGLSRREFDRARKVLIDSGRIRYKESGKKNKAGRYEFVVFTGIEQYAAQQTAQQTVQQNGQQHEQQNEHQTDIQKNLASVQQNAQQNEPQNVQQDVQQSDQPYEKPAGLFSQFSVMARKPD